MKSYRKYFQGKKITLMGLGLLGRGVGDACFLAKQGADVTVTDLKTKKQLLKSVNKLKNYKNIRFVLGEHQLNDFTEADLIIKGAGVPLDSLFIKEALKKGVPVRMSTALFAELTPATVIGITGTKGKTTVSSFLYHILKENNSDVFLGGNARLVSTLAHLSESKKEEIAILELDSWQLQGFAEAEISPPFSIFTNFTPDHLNYYKNDMDLYLNDKASIFINQKESDLLIVGEQAYSKIMTVYGDKIRSQVKKVSTKDLPNNWTVSVPGEHNRYNATLAYTMANFLKVPLKITQKALANFSAVSGRLQYRGVFKGRKFYNDNNATTPEATVSAINTLKKEGRVILITGGADKNLPLDNLTKAIEKNVFKFLLLPGSGSDELRKKCKKFKPDLVDSLEEAVEKAYSFSDEGDIILFSPAFASFSQFNNEYEREKVFLKEIRKRFSV